MRCSSVLHASVPKRSVLSSHLSAMPDLAVPRLSLAREQRPVEGRVHVHLLVVEQLVVGGALGPRLGPPRVPAKRVRVGARV